jgi:hypothetical protein
MTSLSCLKVSVSSRPRIAGRLHIRNQLPPISVESMTRRMYLRPTIQIYRVLLIVRQVLFPPFKRYVTFAMHVHAMSLMFSNNQLRKIVMAVRSSPQRRQAWLNEVTVSLRRTENALKQVALMLILDVKTRWSSTHQMLRESLVCPLLVQLDRNYYSQVGPWITEESSTISLQKQGSCVIWSCQLRIGIQSHWLHDG